MRANLDALGLATPDDQLLQNICHRGFRQQRAIVLQPFPVTNCYAYLLGWKGPKIFIIYEPGAHNWHFQQPAQLSGQTFRVS